MEKVVQMSVRKYRLLTLALYLVLAVLLFSSGSALVWLKASNEGLYDKKAQLEVELQQLEGQKEELLAEQERLKNPLPR